MEITELNELNFYENIGKKDIVILNVYNERDFYNSFSSVMLNRFFDKYKNIYKIYKIKKESLVLTDLLNLPEKLINGFSQVLLIKHGKIVKILPSFCNENRIINYLEMIK